MKKTFTKEELASITRDITESNQKLASEHGLDFRAIAILTMTYTDAFTDLLCRLFDEGNTTVEFSTEEEN